MTARHSVQIPEDLWKALCHDAAEEMKNRQEVVTPSLRLREILTQYFSKEKKDK